MTIVSSYSVEILCLVHRSPPVDDVSVYDFCRAKIPAFSGSGMAIMVVVILVTTAAVFLIACQHFPFHILTSVYLLTDRQVLRDVTSYTPVLTCGRYCRSVNR